MENRPTRNNGLDLLRIVSMFMVATLHVLLQGGVLETAERVGPTAYWAAWTLESLNYCAVDCFALITGYVSLRGGMKFSSVAAVWLRTVFWCVALTVGFRLLVPGSTGWAQLPKALTPIVNRSYWYISAYVGCALLSPLLFAAVRALSREQMRRSLAALFVGFSVLPSLADADCLVSGRQYSALWLALMILTGAAIAQHGLFTSLRPGACAALYLAGALGAVAVKAVMELCGCPMGTNSPSNRMLCYDSPFVTLSALALFLLFRQLRVERGARLIRLLAPTTFSVYIIHGHSLVRTHIMTYRFSFLARLPVPLMLLGALGCAAGIYALCTLMDMPREWLFRRLGIKEKLRKLDRPL